METQQYNKNQSQDIPEGYNKIICEEIIDQTQTRMTRRTVYEKQNIEKSPPRTGKNNQKRPLKMFRSNSFENLPSQEEVHDTFQSFKQSFQKLGKIILHLFGYIFKQIGLVLAIIVLITKTVFKEISKGFLITCAFINKKCLRKINGKDPFKRIKTAPISQSSNFYGKKMYTVILDLDGTMVLSKGKKFDDDCIECPVVFKSGSKQSYYVKKRPYLDEFLEHVSQYCNVAVFTSGLQEYADAILDKIDNKNILKRRFYRQHCIKHPQGYIKDLSVVESDETKIIMIDDNTHATQLNRDNTFIIPAFDNKTKDEEWFVHLKHIIDNIRSCKPQDVRDMISDIKIQYF